MRLIILALFICLLSSCSKQDGTSILQEPIRISGLKNLGNVILGDRVKTKVIFTNYSTVESVNVNLPVVDGFEAVSISPGCYLPVIKPKQACSVEIIFSPTLKKSYEYVINFEGQSASIVGQGIIASILYIPVSNFSFPGIFVGSVNDFSVEVENAGEAKLFFPNVQLIPEVTLKSQTCDAEIPPGEKCTIYFSFSTTLSGRPTTKVFTISNGNQITPISILADVSASDPFGDIIFPLITTTQARGSTITITSNVISDVFGNAVEDGMPATIQLNGLESTTGLSSISTTTVNGRISFDVVVPTSGPSTGTISATIKASNGNLEFQIGP